MEVHFPDRENARNLSKRLKIFFTQGIYLQHRKIFKSQGKRRNFCLDRSVATLQGNWWHGPIIQTTVIIFLNYHLSFKVKTSCPLTDRWKEVQLYGIYAWKPNITAVELQLYGQLSHSAKTEQNRWTKKSSLRTRGPLVIIQSHLGFTRLLWLRELIFE